MYSGYGLRTAVWEVCGRAQVCEEVWFVAAGPSQPTPLSGTAIAARLTACSPLQRVQKVEQRRSQSPSIQLRLPAPLRRAPKAANCCLCPSPLQRVGDLERRRAEVVQTTLHSFVHIYRSQVVPLQEIAGAIALLGGGGGGDPGGCGMGVVVDGGHPTCFKCSLPQTRPAVLLCVAPADELQQLLDQIDAASDLESFTETAASSVQRREGCGGARWGLGPRHLGLCMSSAGHTQSVGDTSAHSCATDRLSSSAHFCTVASLCLAPIPACSADVLSSRQREAVDQLCSELLGSAEIVR